MLFTSHLFIFLFLPLVVVACWQVQKTFGRYAAIVAMIVSSLLFYYLNGHSQISVLLASLIFNCLLNWLWFNTDNDKNRRIITLVLIFGNIAGLAYYKYGAFLA